jgi:hypothetical protein
MRRTLIAAVATSALALPGVALAHDGSRQRVEDHHGAHQGERHHARHHRHARLIAFRAHAPTTAAPGTGAGTTPSPTPVASERAGTIASFTGGTLTITLNDGTTVSGMVTPRTEIECHAASATAADHGDVGRGDGGSGGGSSSGPGPGGQAGESGRDGRDDAGGDNDAGDNPGGNDAGDNDAGDDDAHDEAEHCMPAALVPGASVREALLSVSSAGAFWVKLEL